MGRTVTEEDVARFAELSGDHHRLHVDAAFAAGTRYGRPIAHGLLTAALASGLLYAGGVITDDVEALVEVKLQFLAPVVPGDELADETHLVESRPTRNGGRLERYESLLSTGGERPVLRAEWLLLRREPEGA